MIRRLQRKFVRISLLSVALILLLLTVTVNVTYRVSVDRDLTEMLELIYKNQGKVPVDRESTGKDTGTAPKKKSRGGQFYQETPYSTRYFVLRISGNDLESSELSHIASVTDRETEEYKNVALAQGEGYGYYGNYKLYVVKEGTNRFMAVFLDCYQEQRSAGKILIWSFVADALCIVLAYISVSLFSRKAVEPVIRTEEQQKRFITDAGHELKTPLTVISTDLSVLEMEVGSRKWIRKAQEQVTKMSGLISSMVTLSGMDEGIRRNAMTGFSLSEAVTETAESFRDTAEEAELTLVTEIEDGIGLYGDRESICRLVSILMENALKYSTPEGTVTVRCSREQRKIMIRQINPCEEIQNETLERLFERFYRPDQSRASSTGGFGLGLSIAKSIAEMHNGTISAKYSDGNIIFTVLLKPQ